MVSDSQQLARRYVESEIVESHVSRRQEHSTLLRSYKGATFYYRRDARIISPSLISPTQSYVVLELLSRFREISEGPHRDFGRTARTLAPSPPARGQLPRRRG